MTTPRLTLITIVATLAYLGLAILGWGGFAAFFSHPALIALAIVLFALSGVALFSGGNLSPGVREDRANRWVIIAFGLIGVLAAYLPAYTDRKGFWTFQGDAIRWLGVVLFAAGGALRIWPVFVLGHRFSGLVAIQPGHKLVTSGVYGVIRHPSYLGLLVNSLRYADEIRKPEDFFNTIAADSVDEDELAMMEQIIKRKTREFDPSGFADHYQTAVRELIEKKLEGKLPEKAP